MSYFLGYGTARPERLRRDGVGRKMVDVHVRHTYTHDRVQNMTLMRSCFEALTGTVFSATATSLARC